MLIRADIMRAMRVDIAFTAIYVTRVCDSAASKHASDITQRWLRDERVVVMPRGLQEALYRRDELIRVALL